MKILVTGGAGFLGNHLCERLLAEGHLVHCIDNFYTGFKKNIAPFEKNPRFHLITHNITEPFFIEVDQIYHLACPASPLYYQKNPIRTLKTSVLGTLNVLGLAKRLNVRVFLASTSEVYGDPEVHPQTETYWGNLNPIGIRSCYDEGKRVAECLFFDYHRSHNTDIRVARIFNTYGPKMGQNDGRVVSNFITQALQGHPLTVYGEGKQTRSFCYIEDLIEGLIRMMNNTQNFLGPVNLGNPLEYTILSLANKILALTKSRSPIVYKPLPQDDPKVRCPDISLAIQKLGWQPKIHPEEGLKRTIAYFRAC